MGEAVDHFEQMVVTCQRWKQAYEVDMDVLEAFLGLFKPLERSLHMDLNLVALTTGTCAGPSGHVRFG